MRTPTDAKQRSELFQLSRHVLLSICVQSLMVPLQALVGLDAESVQDCAKHSIKVVIMDIRVALPCRHSNWQINANVFFSRHNLVKLRLNEFSPFNKLSIRFCKLQCEEPIKSFASESHVESTLVCVVLYRQKLNNHKTNNTLLANINKHPVN